MKVKVMSSFIDADGDVTALTKDGIYIYKQRLKEPEKLLKKLAKADEINLDHWIKEHEFKEMR
jgi:hypothetical protein